MIRSMNMEIRAGYAIRSIKDSIQARLTFSRETLRKTRDNCREFMGDFCSFLSEKPSSILMPIHPNRYQLTLVYLFLEQVGKAAVREEKHLYSNVGFSGTSPRYFTVCFEQRRLQTMMLQLSHRELIWTFDGR